MKKVNFTLVFSCLILFVMIIAAVSANIICSHDPNLQDLTQKFIVPFSRDISWGRIIWAETF